MGGLSFFFTISKSLIVGSSTICGRAQAGPNYIRMVHNANDAQPSAVEAATTLLAMGFEQESVFAAVVAAKGDAAVALDTLTS